MWIEAYRHDALTPIFKALTYSGDPTFFLAVFAVGYWVIHRRIFARVTLLLAVTGLVNSVLKGLFQVPRPDPALALIGAEGWSFPSGHSMVAAAVWPWLALEYQRAGGRRWALPVACLWALGVATSRVYLGVHTVRDVAWGLLLGALLLALARHWQDSPPEFWDRLSLGSQCLYLSVPVILAVWLIPVYDHDTTGAKTAGALLAIWPGLIWAQWHTPMLPRKPPARLLAVVLGLVVTFGLRWGLKELPLGLSVEVVDFFRYGLIGAWIAAGAPWTFQRLGLTDNGT